MRIIRILVIAAIIGLVSCRRDEPVEPTRSPLHLGEWTFYKEDVETSGWITEYPRDERYHFTRCHVEIGRGNSRELHFYAVRADSMHFDTMRYAINWLTQERMELYAETANSSTRRHFRR